MRVGALTIMVTEKVCPARSDPPGLLRPGTAHMCDREIAAALDALADAIGRIRPVSRRNPHAFYEDRSEAARRACLIAEWLRTGRKPQELEALQRCRV